MGDRERAGGQTTTSGYWLAAGLALGMALSNGYARFAYALILPSMRTDLAWSYTEAGALNTANGLGYLLGAFLTFRFVRRLGAARPFIAGLWVTAVAVGAMGLTPDFNAMMGLRALAGISGAMTFIAGSVLAASIFPSSPGAAARAIAIYFGGGGVGLLASALSIPPLLAASGDKAWPSAWLLLGGLSLVSALLATLAARRIVAPAAEPRRVPWSKGPMLAAFLAYGCFALGNTAYMTFIIAFMRDRGATAVEVAAFWSVLGIATLLSPRLWNGPMARWRGGLPLAGVLAVTGIGAGLPLLSAGLPMMLLSALLFGSFFMTPASVTAFVKASLPPVVWGEAVAAFTLFFALLQFTGPVLWGMLSDFTGSLVEGLGLAAAVLILGAAIAAFQKDLGVTDAATPRLTGPLT